MERRRRRLPAAQRAQIRDQAFTGRLPWGLWNIPESELGVLGEVAGKDVLEFGCGGAQWSTALARNGARPVGFDLSERQLEHARRLRSETGIAVPLVQADAEQLPFGDASFDIVFADHGAFTFADPYRTLPEATRVLRPGGLLAFNRISPFYDAATPLDAASRTRSSPGRGPGSPAPTRTPRGWRGAAVAGRVHLAAPQALSRAALPPGW